MLKDMDLVNWLEKKLNDAGVWSGRITASMLTKEMLEELETCFQAIDMQTKLKIISCIPHMNPRKLSTVQSSLAVLLELAGKDADDWVETIADMYRDMPSATVIAPGCSNNDSHFAKTLEDMSKCFQKHLEQGNLQLSPEGHNIVSSSVNKASFGTSPEPYKLFILRKKPKSFNLMNDMMRQCTKLVEANREKNNGLWSSTVPIKMRSTLRSANNDLPMKGIPTQNPCKLNSGFTYEPKKFQRHLIKREGGAKLLGMNGDAKKAAAQQKQRKNSKRRDEKAKQEGVENASMSCGDDHASYMVTPEITEQHTFPHSVVDNEEPENTQTPYQRETRVAAIQGSSQMPENSYILRQTVHGIQNPPPQIHHQLDHNQPQHVQHFVAHHIQSSPMLSAYSGAPFKSTFQARDQQTPVQRAREIAIMKQCNEMLRDANSLDQNGRQIVIAFMTGNRCNPRPELGNVITMKLSETIEDGLADNKLVKMKVETFFQAVLS
ncbi:hypothetical protein DICVIV_11698 [Dictyocaulus viviparus]|uniref:HDAg domain-containing protein n=1 Tax=Dictyocaulus viviparus TaxID=29172 RepID=A0A0D8XCK0_DICVI|nr:hypothetical protein DICVIV_11698 [Dictyocaulus viviparus]